MPKLARVQIVFYRPATVAAVSLFVLFLLTPSESSGQGAATTLWASPTSGPPLALPYAPQGAQCHIVIRPAAIWNNAEARRTIRALGPEFERWWSSWAASCGLEPSALEWLQLSITRRESGALESTAVLALTKGQQLSDGWKQRSELGRSELGRSEPGRTEPGRTEPGRTKRDRGAYYELQRSALAAWVPEGIELAMTVIGAPETVEEIATRPGVAPFLRREMEQLRKQSDAERMLSILVSPQFLRANLDQFPPATKDAMKFVEDLWNEEAQAISFSAHLVDDHELFVELKLVGTYESQRALPNRIQSAIRRYVTHARDRTPEALGGLASRWSRMVEFTGQQIRVANDGDVTIASTTLPAAAAHNLALGSNLLVQRELGPEQPARNPPAGSAIRSTTGLAPAALVGVLKTRIDFKFDQQSLEFALHDLQRLVRGTVADAAAFEIQLDGQSLRAEGITRNQQIVNFQTQNKTIAQVLTQLVRQADPTLASADVNSPRPPTTLVWAAGPDLQNKASGQVVMITTVKVARQRGYRIPRDFRNR